MMFSSNPHLGFKPVLILVAGLVFTYGHIVAETLVILEADFDQAAPGPFVEETLTQHFGETEWHILKERATIVTGNKPADGQALEVFYPANRYRSKDSGISFVRPIPPAQEYRLTYRVRFSKDFPFNKGGKLPGLSSGGSKYTGGRKPPPEGGWSARYMWRREGELELYFYHPKMKGPSGDRHSFKMRCDSERWYTLTQQIRVNDPGKTNGTIKVWVNGEPSLELTDLFLRGEKIGLIDSFHFSTFFGGSSKDWAPNKNCTIQFDSFVIASDPQEDE